MIRMQFGENTHTVETAQDVVDRLRQYVTSHPVTILITDGAIGPVEPDTLVTVTDVSGQPPTSTARKKK